MNRGRVVALVGAALHLPLALMTAVAMAEDPLFALLTGPSLVAAVLAVVGASMGPRRPRAAANLVLAPGILALGWLLFLGLLAPGALLFLLGAPLLPLGGWLMRQEIGGQSPLPDLPP